MVLNILSITLILVGRPTTKLYNNFVTFHLLHVGKFILNRISMHLITLIVRCGFTLKSGVLCYVVSLCNLKQDSIVIRHMILKMYAAYKILCSGVL